MLCTVDEIDREDLACIIGQNPDGSAPLQLQLPRLRRLLSLAGTFVALVDDPCRVHGIPCPHLAFCAPHEEIFISWMPRHK